MNQYWYIVIRFVYLYLFFKIEILKAFSVIKQHSNKPKVKEMERERKKGKL